MCGYSTTHISSGNWTVLSRDPVTYCNRCTKLYTNLVSEINFSVHIKHVVPESLLKSANSFEDDLSLGAEGTVNQIIIFFASYIYNVTM